MLFRGINVEDTVFAESIGASKRGKAISVSDMYGADVVSRLPGIENAKVHDANFAFLSNKLAKLVTEVTEPVYNITYLRDIDVDYGGGFVDYVSRMEINWAGLADEFNNVFGNNANYIPRVNAGMSQKKVDVYTFELAYDLRWIELEKAKQLEIQKSIEDIYKDIIVASFDMFCEKVGYLGIHGGEGLFNSSKVAVTTIDNSASTVSNGGFIGMTDNAVVSFFNGLFETYLLNSNMNAKVLPDRILVPTFVGKDLTGRADITYQTTLRKFIAEHNLAVDESDEVFKVKIESRGVLNTLGTGGHGRIVAYRKDKRFVRMDIPYPMQHYITLPNIERFGYTSAFVGQVSAVSLPMNTSDAELGIVSYYDFVK